MVSKDPVTLFTSRPSLVAAIAAIFTITHGANARATTITVNSLADTGAPAICVLRDAITAANTMTTTNGCTTGTGNDTIQFSLTGTIVLASTLPDVTGTLTINGPALPGITLDGDGKVRVMEVASGAIVNINNLTVTHGSSATTNAGGILNGGTLAIDNSTFTDNSAAFGGGGISNGGTLSVTNSTFSHNSSIGGGSIKASGI